VAVHERLWTTIYHQGRLRQYRPGWPYRGSPDRPTAT
jgi:hypothetical protein